MEICFSSNVAGESPVSRRWVAGTRMLYGDQALQEREGVS